MFKKYGVVYCGLALTAGMIYGAKQTYEAKKTVDSTIDTLNVEIINSTSGLKDVTVKLKDMNDKLKDMNDKLEDMNKKNS